MWKWTSTDLEVLVHFHIVERGSLESNSRGVFSKLSNFPISHNVEMDKHRPRGARPFPHCGTWKFGKFGKFGKFSKLFPFSNFFRGLKRPLPCRDTKTYSVLCVCVFSSHSFWTSSSLHVPAGVTQEKGHTGFLIHLLSAVRASIFFTRRIQPFLSLVDCEVGICVLTISFSSRWAFLVPSRLYP